MRNDENIGRMRVSKNLFIDTTFHHPSEYKELFIFMYKDLVTLKKYLVYMYFE